MSSHANGSEESCSSPVDKRATRKPLSSLTRFIEIKKKTLRREKIRQHKKLQMVKKRKTMMTTKQLQEKKT